MEQLEQDEYELCMHNDDDDQEVLEREEEKELEEFLYRQIHYASQLETEIQKLGNNNENKETTFPEATALQVVLGDEKQEKEEKKYQVAVVSEDTDQWDVDDTDFGKTKQTSTSRYYTSETGNLPNIYCYNCNQRGHVRKECPEEKKCPTCYLCGTLGHYRQECPNDLCYNCLKPGHIAKECEKSRRKPWLLKCKRCDVKGHEKDECKEIWRQYHCTVEYGKIVKPKNHREKNKHRYCYNCASSKHFGENCPERSFSNRVYSQFIVSYDKCSVTPDNTNTQTSDNKEESTENVKKKIKEKNRKEESKSSDAKKTKTKKEVEKTNQLDGIETNIHEKNSKKQEKSKSKVREVDTIETNNTEKNKKQEKSKSKTEDKTVVIDNTPKREGSEDSSNNSTKDATNKGKYDRIKGVLKNMWVVDDINFDNTSVTASEKKNKKKFSVMEDLGISSHKKQIDESIKNIGKKESLKRKVESILSKGPIEKSKKLKLSDTSEVDTTYKTINKNEKCPESGSQHQKQSSKSRTTKQAKLQKSGSEEIETNSPDNMDQLQSGRKVYPLRSKDKTTKDDTGKQKKSKQETSRPNSRVSNNDLDIETLKNLQVILDDSDDDPEGDVITYQSPCPIPVVNFIELSSDSGGNDDEEEKIDVTTGTGDVTNKFRKGDNQVSIRNIDYDDTCYDPCQVYEKGLSAYNISSYVKKGNTTKSLQAKDYTPKQLKGMLTNSQKRQIHQAVAKEKKRLGISRSPTTYKLIYDDESHREYIRDFRLAETDKILNSQQTTTKKSKKEKKLNKKNTREKHGNGRQRVDRGFRSLFG